MTFLDALLVGFGAVLALSGAGLLYGWVIRPARLEREPTEFEDCLFSPLPTAETREAGRDEGVRH